jgi:Cyclic nucleotide-binding domain
MDQVNAAELAEMAPRIALLQRAAILVESSRWAVEHLARQSTVVDVVPGAAVLHLGDPADALYVIESGTLNVKSRDGASKEVELASLGHGDFFGEIWPAPGHAEDGYRDGHHNVQAASYRRAGVPGGGLVGRSFTLAARGGPGPPGEQPRLRAPGLSRGGG